MKPAAGILCGVMILASAGGAVAQSATAADLRAFVGTTWSGGEEAGIAGHEAYGGAYVRDATAISLFRSLSDPREWVMVSKGEIGRSGRHALWRGLDAVRITARSAESAFAYACRRAGSGAGTVDWEPGLVGFVGTDVVETGEPGLLHAEQAIQIEADGSLSPVSERVVCADEAYGL